MKRGKGDPRLGKLALRGGYRLQHRSGRSRIAETDECLRLERARRDGQRIGRDQERLQALRLGEQGERFGVASLAQTVQPAGVPHEDLLGGLRVRAKRLLRALQP